MIIKIKPQFIEKPWGGTYSKDNFSTYNIRKNNIGEIYIISGIKDFPSLVENGIYKNRFLKDIYDEHNELFYDEKKYIDFPILLKIITAYGDLSIQLHPDDSYAKKHCNQYGKNESWYIISLFDNNNKIVYGHTGESLEKTREMIKNSEWKKFVRKIQIKPGDLIDTKPGTIHSILGGTILYEIQQPSTITYRVYDFDRKPLRELHTKQVLDLIYAPQDDLFPIKYKNIENKEFNILANKFYQLDKYIINSKTDLEIQTGSFFKIITIIDGYISINTKKFFKFETFLLTTHSKINVTGNATILISYKK